MRLALLGIVLVSTGVAAAAPPPTLPPDVAVEARDGLYHVTATFSIPQPAAVAFAVLTDYQQIPQFMPDVQKSQILERNDGTIVVEQEAVARMMMFSRRVHLVLEIAEAPHSIRFRDRCGRSFERYEGVWTISERQGQVEIGYTLTARPTFEVPEFLLRRLLKRDAQTMIDRLRGEIARRASASHEVPDTP